jgi:hypothetical protein
MLKKEMRMRKKYLSEDCGKKENRFYREYAMKKVVG